jgi:hypothetical protein
MGVHGCATRSSHATALRSNLRAALIFLSVFVFVVCVLQGGLFGSVEQEARANEGLDGRDVVGGE